MSKQTLKSNLFIPILLAAILLSSCSLIGTGDSQTNATPIPTVTATSGTTAEANLVPRDSARLYASSYGKVAEVLVKEGDLVSQGDVLVRFGDTEAYQAAVKSAELEKLSAQQQLDELNRKADLAAATAHQTLLDAQKVAIDAQQALDDLDTDDYQKQLDDAEVNISAAKDDLDTAQEDVDKYKNLDADNITRKNAETARDDAQKKYDDAVRERDLLKIRLDQAKAAVDAANAQQADAQYEYDQNKNGPNPDDLALAQARLDNAIAQLASAQKVLHNQEITAPFTGTVIEVNVTQDENVMPNQQIALLADLSELYAETNDLTEIDVVKIKTGQTASIVADALPDVTINGTVTHIYDSYKEKGGDIVYRVRVKLDQPDPRMRWGMTVTVTFGN